MSHARADSQAANRDGVWTIVVAGGSGVRFGARKQFVEIAGRTVLFRSVEAAVSSSEGVVAVVPADSLDQASIELACTVVAGGASRAGSVRAGLNAVPDDAQIVLVHDAARPLVTHAVFQRVVEAVRAGAKAVIPTIEVADSIRHVDGHPIDRSTLRAVQTPQGFDAASLRAGHASAGDATDDATLVGALGHEVVMVEGDPDNRKLTVPSDLISAEALLMARQSKESAT